MRTIIEVPDDDIKNLDRIVEQQKKSRATIIREAIRLYLEGRFVGSNKAAFGYKLKLNNERSRVLKKELPTLYRMVPLGILHLINTSLLKSVNV